MARVSRLEADNELLRQTVEDQQNVLQELKSQNNGRRFSHFSVTVSELTNIMYASLFEAIVIFVLQRRFFTQSNQQ